MSSEISFRPVSGGTFALGVAGSGLTRILSEPGVSFASAAQTAVSAGMGAVGSLLGASSGDLGSLLSMQIQIQREMQVVSMISNVEKSKHETEMAPIRNMRVG